MTPCVKHLTEAQVTDQQSCSPIRSATKHLLSPRLRSGIATTLSMILAFEAMPAVPAAASPLGDFGTTISEVLGLGQNAETPAPDAEHVVVRFSPNVPEDTSETVRGQMGTHVLVLDGEERALPENEFSLDGHRFMGWSTTPDGKDDDILGIPAISVPDEQMLLGLDFDEEVTTMQKDGNDESHPVTQIVPHSLAEAMRDNSIMLYAQWQKRESPTRSDVTATVTRRKGLSAVTIEGNSDATIKQMTAAIEESGVAADEAIVMAEAVSRTNPVRNATHPDEMEHRKDDSEVNAVDLVWVTPDTVDNGQADLLYLKPGGELPNDLPQSVRMRVNWALSGEHDYDVGDINITFPATMFKDRDGNDIGRMTIPYPENPKTTDDFNWMLQADGTYLLTNTRRMDAATSGYIEFQIDQLVPHKMRDMSISDDFWVHVEVVTHRGNLIGMTSSDIRAQIDTEEVVRSANKYSTNIDWVVADQIPQHLRRNGVDEYVVVTWYMYSYASGNTEFTLRLDDMKMDEYDGFVIYPEQNASQPSYSNPDIYTGYISGGSDGSGLVSLGYQTIQVAYPAEQFLPDTDYVFENKVTYTLTEKDPAVGDDPQKVTTAEATAARPWAWHMPQFDQPTGHFMVNKIGNDGTAGSNTEPYWAHPYQSYYSSRLDTDVHNRDDYYGIYPSALNDIQDGRDLEIAYTVESIGYILPWTCEGDYQVLANYGKRPVTMVTYDSDDTKESPIWLNGNVPMQLGTDYEYKAVEFPTAPSIGTAKAINLNPDGSIAFIHAGDGTVEYEPDYQAAHIPPVTLSAKVAGEWQDIAVANWSTGALVLTAISGGVITGNRVMLPQGTEQIRTTVSSKNAYIWYYIRPILTVHNTGKVGEAAEQLFAISHTPQIDMYNSTYMQAYDDQNEMLVDIHKDAMDSLCGYSTDIAAIPSKAATQTPSDVDYDRRLVTMHYTAEVQEQSYVPDVATYDQAVADGRLIPETSGIWYDLLPKGMDPILSTVKLRAADAIRDVYAISDYRGTGRTLLVVEADLTPKPEPYRDNGDVRRYMDRPRISFDATYPFDAIKDYGDTDIHNVIAFESLSRNPIGTVSNHGGEPDNPRSSNNVATSVAFANDAERDAMTELDSDHSGNRFVYAGVAKNLDILSAARTSLAKDIRVDNDDKGWSKGTYDDVRTVYEGGWYSYRLRMMSNANTTTKNLILYDSLENFYAVDGNDPADIDAPRWKGSLVSIDTSQLVAKGIRPVVYYSTVDELMFAPNNASNDVNQSYMDLSNTAVWTLASQYGSDDLSGVKAIAIDCSQGTDGNDFELLAMESVTVIVNMHAPSGEPARTYIQQDAHAYNNIYLSALSIDDRIPGSGETNLIRNDYTKVGLAEHKLEVRKEWDDDGNRDGIRPNGVTVHLYANGQDTGQSKVLDDENDWHDEFTNIPYTDNMGEKIHYAVREDAVTGYAASVMRTAEGGFMITNRHEPERINISGNKTWVGNEEEIPAYIVVKLFADGTHVASTQVRPDATGTWSYQFTGLHKYRPTRQEIAYTVEESTARRTWAATVDGYDITNTYHPYGDLRLEKHVIGQTAAYADTEFRFRLELKDPSTGEFLPDEFDYATSDGRTGKIGNGGTIDLKDGESVTVTEIPDGTEYRITEDERAGYSVTASENLSGAITGNDTRNASVTNTYHADGAIVLEAKKSLSGRDLQRYQFRAEIYDSTGALIRTGTNRADTAHEGTFAFGALRYTEADVRAEPYVYTIRETVRALGGYTYDSRAYTAYVTVTDNGNGTLSTSVSYKNGDADVTLPLFENEYHASGSIQLKAWKQLKGRDLTDGEFTFKLVDEDGNQVGGLVTSDENGTVIFDEISFDETHVGNTYRYIASEVQGSDATVNYSNEAYAYGVTVVDNGDGTLSFAQDMADVEYKLQAYTYETLPSAVDPMTYNWFGTAMARNSSSQVNIMLYVPDVTTYYSTQNTGNARTYAQVFNEAFNTTVFQASDFTNPGISGSSTRLGYAFELTDTGKRKYIEFISRNREYVGDPRVFDVDTTTVTFRVCFFGKPRINSVEMLRANIAYPPPADGPDMHYYAIGTAHMAPVISSSATDVVPVFTNTLNPGSLKIEKHVAEAPAGHAGDVFNFKVKLTGENLPETMEYDYASLTTTGGTILAGELPVKQGNDEPDIFQKFYDVFRGLFKPTTAYANIADWTQYTSQGSSIQWMIDDDGVLHLEPISGDSGVFKYNTDGNGIYYLPPWDNMHNDITSVVIPTGTTIKCKGSLYHMFFGYSNLGASDLTRLDVSEVTNMYEMFTNCSSDAFNPDMSNWDTSNVTTMHQMFMACSGNSFNPTVSQWDVSNVTDMWGMFDGCSGTSFNPNVGNWNTRSVATMSLMFYGCKGSSFNPDVSQWNTSSVTKMSGMFESCSGGSFNPNVSQWDTRNVTSMSRMFEDCSGNSFNPNISSWNTGQVTNMSYMFTRCKGTAFNPDLSGWNVSSVTTMERMFSECMLTSIDLSGWNTSSVTDMTSMFVNCSKLSSVKLGSRNALQGNTPAVVAVLPTPSSTTTTGKWINADTGLGPLSSAELAELGPNLTSTQQGTWVWQVPATTLMFDANGGTGAMPNQIIPRSQTQEINTPTFVRFDYDVASWNTAPDGSGTTYALGQQITGGDGDTILLYAQWQQRNHTVTLDNGAFEISLCSNMAVTFPDIPAGTAYQVYEETPAGWVLVSQSNTSGNIQPTETSTASFTNRYDEGHTSLSIVGRKLLDGRDAEQGTFAFEMRENGVLVTDPIYNVDGGGIVFPPIVYGEGDVGTHVYTITEIMCNDTNLIYDTHSETVTVTVTKNGQNLSATATYDDDGVVFSNTTLPGSIQITKEATGGGNPNQEFEFEVTLKNFARDEAAPESSPENTNSVLGDLLNVLSNLFAPQTAYADSDITEWQICASSQWKIDSAGTLIIRPISGTTGVLSYAYGSYNPPWLGYAGNITGVSVPDGMTISVPYAARIFKGTQMSTVDLSGFDFSGCSYAPSMFEDCTNLTTFNLCDIDWTSIAVASGMFKGCSALVDVNAAGWVAPSLGDASEMFSGCGVTTLALDGIQLSRSDSCNMSGFIAGCSALEHVSIRNASIGAYSLTSFISGCPTLKTVTLDNTSFPRCASISGFIPNCPNVTSLSFRNVNLSNVSNTGQMVPASTGTDGFTADFSGAKFGTSLASLFQQSNLTEVSFVGADTSRVTGTSNMFANCRKLLKVDMHGLDLSSCSNSSVGWMFDNSCAEGYDINLRDVSFGNYLGFMFDHVGDLDGNGSTRSSYGVIDFRGSDMSRVNYMFAFLRYANAHVYMSNLDLSSVNPTNGGGMYNFSSYFGHDSDDAVLDLSNTKLGTTCYGMFYQYDAKTLILTNVDTSSVTQMQQMFYGMNRVTELDLTSFDVSHVTDMTNMFYNCNALTTIYTKADADWSIEAPVSSPAAPVFDSVPNLVGGNGTTFMSSERTTALARVDGLDGMMGYFTNGTGNTLVTFGTNGGTILVGDSHVIQRGTVRSVSVPRVVRNGFVLTDWNTKADGTGTSYGLCSAVTPELGATLVLYAQWTPVGEAYAYDVVHKLEKADAPGTYEIAGRETRYATATSGVTIRPNIYYGFSSPAARTTDIAADGSTVITFEYARRRFDVTMTLNDGTTRTQAFIGGIRQALDAAPTVDGKRFVGWFDGTSGENGFYADRQEVTFDAATTLYAQYVDASTTSATDGLDTVMRVKVKAGETVTIPNIPAGTEYEIREIDIPNGWTQTGIIGETGEVSANTVSEVTVTNAYSTSGTFDLVAYKHLQGRDPVDGQFSFELVDPDGVVIQTVANGDVDTRETLPDSDTGEPVTNPHYGQAPIAFRNITSPAPGTYTYKIREVRGNDTQVTYDTHEENITVQIIDNQNGTSHAVITYDNDGPIFNNEMKDGNLQLSKTIEDETPASKDATFTFDLELVDSEGTPIPDASYELVRQVAPTPAGVTGEGMTPTSNFVAEEGHVVVTYDANGGYYEGGYAKNLVGYEVTPTGVTPVDGEGEYADPLSPASDRSFGGWYLDADCTDGQEFQQSSLTANQSNQTVYAKWNESPEADQSTTLTQFTDGHATITISGGEKVWINGLPIGTTYTLTEQDAPGWTPENPSGMSGRIQAATTAAASVANRYEATGSFPVSATKTVTGIEMEDGAFTFILTDDDGEFIAQVTNDGDGNVAFPAVAIRPEWVGSTLTFHVSEERGDVGGIQYDTHTENVSVAFADDGAGTLTADVTYDDNGCEFHNTRSLFMPITGMTGLDDNQLLNALAAIAIAGMAILCGKRKQQIDEKLRQTIRNAKSHPVTLVLPRRTGQQERRGWHD